MTEKDPRERKTAGEKILFIIFSSKSNPCTMLSERQLNALISEINRDHFNLPLLSESQEEELIEKYVRKLNPHVGPAIEHICGSEYYKVLKTALDETLSLKQRQRNVSSLLRQELSDLLVKEMNANCDIHSLLPEDIEALVLKVAVNSTISILVRWVIGELDEEIEEAIDAIEDEEEAAAAVARSITDERQGLLSDRQARAVVNEMNEDVNIPFLNEETEGNLFQNYVTMLNPHFQTALETICDGTVYATTLKLALSDLSIKQRRRQIAALLRQQLSEPLTIELNEKVDFYDSIFLSDKTEERIEHEILQRLVNKLLWRLAHWIIHELDEQIEESLE